MIIKRIEDKELIECVYHSDRVSKVLGFDLPILIHRQFYYLGAFDEGQIVGVGILIPYSDCTLDGHIAFLDGVSPKKTLDSGLKMIQWIKNNTDYIKIILGIPDKNKAACRFAKRLGFKEEGYSPNSYRLNNEIYGRVLLGIGV